MERIKVYRTNAVWAKFFIVFGAVFSVSGLLFLLRSLDKGFNPRVLSGDWSSVFFIIQGLLFILMGYSNLRIRKYFIEWDENEINFLLPGIRYTETIKLDEIKSVNIRLFEIELNMTNGSRILKLENLQFEDIRKIKARFESLG